MQVVDLLQSGGSGAATVNRVQVSEGVKMLQSAVQSQRRLQSTPFASAFNYFGAPAVQANDLDNSTGNASGSAGYFGFGAGGFGGFGGPASSNAATMINTSSSFRFGGFGSVGALAAPIFALPSMPAFGSAAGPSVWAMGGTNGDTRGDHDAAALTSTTRSTVSERDGSGGSALLEPEPDTSGPGEGVRGLDEAGQSSEPPGSDKSGGGLLCGDYPDTGSAPAPCAPLSGQVCETEKARPWNDPTCSATPGHRSGPRRDHRMAFLRAGSGSVFLMDLFRDSAGEAYCLHRLTDTASDTAYRLVDDGGFDQWACLLSPLAGDAGAGGRVEDSESEYLVFLEDRAAPPLLHCTLIVNYALAACTAGGLARELRTFQLLLLRIEGA